LAGDLVDAIQFSTCSSGTSAASQSLKHTLQLASDTELAHHYIQ